MVIQPIGSPVLWTHLSQELAVTDATETFMAQTQSELAYSTRLGGSPHTATKAPEASWESSCVHWLVVIVAFRLSGTVFVLHVSSCVLDKNM